MAALQKSANKSVPIAETSFLAFRGIFCCAVGSGEWERLIAHCSLRSSRRADLPALILIQQGLRFFRFLKKLLRPVSSLYSAGDTHTNDTWATLPRPLPLRPSAPCCKRPRRVRAAAPPMPSKLRTCSWSALWERLILEHELHHAEKACAFDPLREEQEHKS